MPKSSSVFVCQQCSYQSPTFLGRCPECGTWNSLVEQITQKTNANGEKLKTFQTSEIINISNIEHKKYPRLISKLEEFNRVLGGGIVVGSVVLVSGDPGIGKSTLLTQIALEFDKTLYVAGEESAQQIKLRADR